MYIYFYDTIIGKIGITEKNNAISSIIFTNEEISDLIKKETILIKTTFKEIEDYFNGKLKKFSVPIAPEGTEFMNQVWNELMKIPYGETCSYQSIAIKINNEKASRAIGLANNKNPIPIIIPCHRVIGKNKKLVGYAGGLHIKAKLLEIEQKYKN